MSVLFAGAIGALLVFCLGILKEWWMRHRERKGLLRLVEAEIRNHDSSISKLESLDDQGYWDEPPARPLRMDLWEQTRAKLAQLLPHNKLTELSTYYRKAQVLNNLLDPHTSPNTRRRDIPTVVNDLAQRGSTVQLWIQDDYIGQAG